jgi:hypothetical protein
MNNIKGKHGVMAKWIRTAAILAALVVPVFCLADATAPTVDLSSSASSNTVSPAAAPTVNPTGANLPYGLATCKGVNDPSDTADTRPLCDFNQLFIEARTFIDWLFAIAVPLAIALFAYGGILYITGRPGNISQANAIFKATGIGFGIMLLAWALVYTVVTWITGSGTGITTFLGQ